MHKLKQVFSIAKITAVMAVVGVGLYAVNPRFSSLTGALIQSTISAVSPTLKGGDWVPPSVPDHIAWTSSNPPKGNFATGANLANYVTCGGYWNTDTAVNVWNESQDAVTGVNHYVRNVYRADNANAPFTLESTTTLSTPFAIQDHLLTSPGVYEVEVAATDNVDNQSAFSPRCRLTIDGKAPTSIASASATVTTNPQIALTALVTDDVSGVATLDLYYRHQPYGGSFGAWTKADSHSLNGELAKTDSFTFDASTHGGDGVYEFRTQATDKAGNVEADHASVDVSVQLDRTVTTPTLASPANGAVKNATGLVLSWNAVSDPHGPVKYDFQRSTDKTFGTVDLTASAQSGTQIDQSTLSNGTYYWRVRACDALGNCSNYSDPWSVVVDNTPPSSSVLLTDVPTKDINNRVVNGDFENGLTGWTAVGDVSAVGSENGVTPFGTKMAKIGRDTDAGAKSIDTNILSQPIPNNGNGVSTVGFWYNFQTYEDTSGFDEPGFMVLVNNQMVHQVWASDIPVTTPGALHGTGWRFISIDVSKYKNPTLSLAFYGGNTGDLSKQSFVYIDNVTTNEATINKDSTFTLTAADNVAVSTVNYRYTVNGTPVTGSGPNGLTFSLTAQPDNGMIEYWAVDTAGNTEAYNTFHVMYDNTAPAAITDLKANDDTNGDFTLNWTAPADENPYGVNQAAAYDLRYSTAAIDPSISDAAWAALPQPSIKNVNGLPGSSLGTPLVAGHAESYQVHVSDGAAQYWFAIKSKDHSGNTSPISNIATTGEPTSVTVTNQPGDVVMNEIMWMGSTASSSDEWLELRNMTSKDVDLSGWSIDNLGSSSAPTITLPAGSKIKANGYFVISRLANTDPNSALLHPTDYVNSAIVLTNGGEQLTLKDNTAKVIDQTPVPAGSWAAGVNGTNKRSMERASTPGDGTDVTNWHNCDSSSCSDARGQYWKTVGNDFGTPGGDNLSFSSSQIQTTVTLTQPDPDHLVTALNGIQNYTTLSYTLEYSHVVDGNTIQEGVTGQKDFSLSTRTLTLDPIYLGTCSTGGQTCVSHAPVTDIKLTVVLKGEGAPDRTVTATLTGQTVQDATSSSLPPEVSSTAD